MPAWQRVFPALFSQAHALECQLFLSGISTAWDEASCSKARDLAFIWSRVPAPGTPACIAAAPTFQEQQEGLEGQAGAEGRD